MASDLKTADTTSQIEEIAHKQLYLIDLMHDIIKLLQLLSDMAAIWIGSHYCISRWYGLFKRLS
jgi:hypothetical protein